MSSPDVRVPPVPSHVTWDLAESRLPGIPAIHHVGAIVHRRSGLQDRSPARAAAPQHAGDSAIESQPRAVVPSYPSRSLPCDAGSRPEPLPADQIRRDHWPPVQPVFPGASPDSPAVDVLKERIRWRSSFRSSGRLLSTHHSTAASNTDLQHPGHDLRAETRRAMISTEPFLWQVPEQPLPSAPPSQLAHRIYRPDTSMSLSASPTSVDHPEDLVPGRWILQAAYKQQYCQKNPSSWH